MAAITRTFNCPTLMIQGTTSDAGKTVLVAGLCRLLARLGVKVAPFKPQNMALNSAVTANGGEIGRAQALQAQACFIEPTTDMNPVLLKPSSDIGAQVIIHGSAISQMDAAAYHDYKKVARDAVLSSHQRLAAQYDAIVVEGAGSPAEINLRHNDIANMGFAEAVDCPVILVADIDRGGVFAHLVGTLELLSESEQARVIGFVINKFRGDISLLQPGLDWLEQRTGKPVLGVVPYLTNFQIDAEDAVAVEQVLSDQPENTTLKVAVPVFSRISNHTDFDPLRLHPQVDLHYVAPGQPIPLCDLIVLPGSKNVRGDLALLRQHGWDQQIEKHLRYGGKLVGICGGFQMLGDSISDPEGIEDKAGTSKGLGLMQINTLLQPEKVLQQVSGTLLCAGQPTQTPVTGYEIHCGISSGPALSRPFAILSGNRPEGAISLDGQIMGTYLHGLFDQPPALNALLSWAGLTDATPFDLATHREQQLNRLADTLEQHLDCPSLLSSLSLGPLSLGPLSLGPLSQGPLSQASAGDPRGASRATP